MSTMVFFLEEQSAKEMLRGLLPRIIPDTIRWHCIHFKGKSDLESQLLRKLRGWQEPDTFFVILRDKDSGDCRTIKNKIADICRDSGRCNKNLIIRIACHELESWYLGDLPAVEKGLNIAGLGRHERKKVCRDPDAVANAHDMLYRITDQLYQKVSGSRSIGPHLSIDRNTSHSFNIFIQGIQKAVNDLLQ